MQIINFCENNKKKIGDFSINWKSTDGWRGYYEVKATKKSGYKLIDSDWMTGNYSDAPTSHSEKEVMTKIEELEKSTGKEIILVIAPTSNVFSLGYDLFTK